jgi:hypothetical protein
MSVAVFNAGCGKDEPQGQSKLAATIEMNEKSEVRGGLGINVDTGDTFEECIDMTNAAYKAEDGQQDAIDGDSSSASLKVSVQSLNSYQDIDKFTDVNVSANIKSATYGGGFNYSQTEKYAMTSDLASVGIHAAADYGRWYLVNPTLKPEYQELYKRSPEDFFKRCGTEFVSGYRRGQGIYVLLSTTKKSLETYEKISASVQASVNTGATSANASASFLNVASELLKIGSLNVEVRAYGAGSISTLQQLITAKADVESLAQQISSLVGNMKPQQSSRYVMLTSPYPGVDYSGSKASPIMREYRRFILKGLFSDYRRLEQDLGRATGIVRDADVLKKQLGGLCTFPIKENKTCDQFLNELDELKTKIEKAIKKIEDLSKECAAATEIDKCKSASSGDVRVSDLTIRTWEQQYRRQLEIEYIKYLRDPDNW